MAQYTKADFEKCFFNPLEKSLLKAYPPLQDLLPKPVEGEDKRPDPLALQGERLLRYILCLYDPKSPIVKANPDMTARKIAAAEVAGYDTRNEAETLSLVYNCDSEYMVGVIVNFLRGVVKSRDWAALMADEQFFWELITRQMRPISAEQDKDEVAAVEKKLKISEGKEAISTRIDTNWGKFLGEDEEIKKRIKKQDYSPEAMAGIK